MTDRNNINWLQYQGSGKYFKKYHKETALALEMHTKFSRHAHIALQRIANKVKIKRRSIWECQCIFSIIDHVQRLIRALGALEIQIPLRAGLFFFFPFQLPLLNKFK